MKLKSYKVQLTFTVSAKTERLVVERIKKILKKWELINHYVGISIEPIK